MVVEENMRGRGYGSRILGALEAARLSRGARKVVLNARENAMEFYARHGYAVVGEAETLSGAIRYVRMENVLS